MSMDLFRKEATGNNAYAMHVVPAYQIVDEINKADAGDREAQYFMTCFADWHTKNRTSTPHCFICSDELVGFADGGDGIGGFAVVKPLNPDSQVAINGAFCAKCFRLGYEEVSRRLMARMEEEYDVELSREQ